MRPELKISDSHRTDQKNFWFQKQFYIFLVSFLANLLPLASLKNSTTEKTPVSQQFKTLVVL